MAEYWEFSNFSDVFHTMSKEHGDLHGGEEEKTVTLWPEHSRSSGRSLPEKV